MEDVSEVYRRCYEVLSGLLAFGRADLLEQCSFTGGRHSSLAISVFLMVKASST